MNERVHILTPLVGIKFASAVLGCDVSQVKARIENGVILYAFDVSRARGARPCIRIFSPCLAEDWSATAPRFSSLSSVIDTILPFESNPSTWQLSKRFNCSPNHTLNLLRARRIKPAKPSSCRPGPGGSPRVELGSARAFLASRRML